MSVRNKKTGEEGHIGNPGVIDPETEYGFRVEGKSGGYYLKEFVKGKNLEELPVTEITQEMVDRFLKRMKNKNQAIQLTLL